MSLSKNKSTVLRVVFMIQSPRQRAHYMSIIRDMVYASVVQ